MDPIDSGQGNGNPPEQSCMLSPSSKGRQRRKNPKYDDYETDYTNHVEAVHQKSPRKKSGGRAASKKTPAKSIKSGGTTQQIADGAIEAVAKEPQESNDKILDETPKKAVRVKKTATKKTPAKTQKANSATQQIPDGEKEAADKESQESSDKISEQTPKKGARAKKTPIKKTPAKKAPIGAGDLPTGEAGVVNSVQQENGTPKRKYVRKRPAQEVEPVSEPPDEASQEEPPLEAEEDTQPVGRSRRTAAKAALKYLQILAKHVLYHPGEESGSQPGSNRDFTNADTDPVKGWNNLKGSKGRKGRKRKRQDSDSGGDEDFVPDVGEIDGNEETEDEEEEEADYSDSDSDSDFKTSGRSPASSHGNRSFTGQQSKCPNGLSSYIMKSVWDATMLTKKFREEHYSSWVFPAWIPTTTDWQPVPESDLEKYLPQERQSAALKVSRADLKEEKTPLQRLSRFAAAPAHSDRWDMLLFAGGPVWAMEWCPTPEGAPASQYIALACHRGMDDQHFANKIYTEPGLVQLWHMGQLEYDSRPDSSPTLAFGLAQDKGFIWHLKWCPAGGWEPPTCDKKAPFLPRLGLLAVATSTGVVTIYSIPHHDALLAIKKQNNSANQQLPIYRAEGVLTLKLGSFKAPRDERSGQVLAMDWLPVKPHNIMAVGFYDGVVGLWDLSTNSALLRVREPDKSLSLLPYRCLLAHDHAVRALAFCPASRYLLVTAGEDRLVKTWDLRRLCNPITVLKRSLPNEIFWPLCASGSISAQEVVYSPFGSHGVHYFDLHLRSFFPVPRTSTVWSLTYSDWLNSLVTSDIRGEVILAILPHISQFSNCSKRTLERRFPIYLTSLESHGAAKEETEDVGGAAGEEGDAVEEEGGKTEGSNVGSEAGKDGNVPLRFQTYNEAVKKYYLHQEDNNMLTFAKSEKRPVWKKMKNTEVKSKMNLDDRPLAAIHKVRISPNLCCHTWVASGGQTGLVRLHCVRAMITSEAQKCISDCRAHFNALNSPKEDPKDDSQAVTDNL